MHFSLFWGGWKYCQSFVKPDHLLVKCLSLTWKTFASISSEQRIVKLHWDIEYGFCCLKNMIKTTKCQFYSLYFFCFILPLPIFLKLDHVFLFAFKNCYENTSATWKAEVFGDNWVQFISQMFYLRTQRILNKYLLSEILNQRWKVHLTKCVVCMMARDEIKIESAFRHANMVIES